MDYQFDVPGLQGSRVSVWDAAALVQLGSVEFHKLRNLLEEFGQRSAVAQGLKAPITDIWRLRSTDQRLYLQTAAGPAGCCVLLGGLKVGEKKLFMHRANGAIVEAEPLCVLDFYVHESVQRQGVGKALFEYMLEAEQLGAEQLAYDRPSGKLLAFLRKHYGLASYVPQPNNFVVFEQFYQHSAGSPGRGGKGGGSTSSSASWGPGALASLGHGRQTLHIIGSMAAEVAGVDNGAADWARSSQRPPTASLQHSVHMHMAQGGSSGGGGIGGLSIACGSACNNTQGGAATPPWSPLGGPGCPSAGTPTRKGEWSSPPVSPTAAARLQDTQQQQQQQQQFPQQVQAPVSYRRGTGMGLIHGRDATDPYSHAGHQQALLAAAANPAPPRSKAGPLPAASSAAAQQQTGSWQQQQQERLQYGFAGGRSQGGCRDSLDRLVGGMEAPAVISSCGGAAGAVGAYGSQPSSGSTFGSSSGGGGGYQRTAGRQEYVVSAPYGSWEPRPGSLLPQDSSQEAERVSLRRQAAQLAQERLQQKQPAWVTAGAGPPGHLLAAPVSAYAVPTADMAGNVVIGGGYQQQWRQQQDGAEWGGRGSGVGGGSRNGRQPVNSLCLSWDGLPQGLAAGNQQQHWGSGLSESRAAAATHRSGSGAASCMRMV